MFQQIPLIFQPGLFQNRSRRASEQRWVDGNHVRFRDGVPAQMGGWRKVALTGEAITGRPCGVQAWRPNDQAAKFAVFGTHTGAFLFDGGFVGDISPSDMTGGRDLSIVGLGYGTGPYGDGDYGEASASSGLLLAASAWTFDMFGEILLGCFNGDGLIRRYQDGVDTLLTTIPEAPTARAICVSPERHVFAFGCDGNPRLVQWSDRESLTVWAPLATNRAGGYEMQVASPFQCGLRVGGVVLGLTETDAVVFQPSFNAAVYSRDTVSEASGCVGPRAACVASDQGGEMALWWGVDGFYMFDGVARRLPCEIHDYVFGDINLEQRAKFEASTNTEFQEVRFSYCSAGSTEIDRCVVLCLANATWSKAHIDRLCWLDRRVFAKPIAIDSAGEIWEHEVGETANGAVLPSYVTSHPLTMMGGNRFFDVSAFWPDLDDKSDGAAFSLIGRDYPGDVDLVHGPYPFAKADEKIDLYASARQFQVKIAGTGSYWEIGRPTIAIQQGGEA